jgi:hypothetical protein
LWEVQILVGTLGGWLKEWQFLVGSLIALLAAAITVNAINRQLRTQGFEAEDARRRLVRAYRASMPEDLDAIFSYALRSSAVAREAVLTLNAKEEGQQFPSTGRRENRLRCPTLPTRVPANLKGLLENLDHANAESISDLLGCYHIQHARLAGALENFNQSSLGIITASKNPVNFNPVFKSTLELYLRAKDMLQFARRETEKIPGAFSTAEVLDALRVLNIDHVISPEAREYCLRFLSDKKVENQG